MANRKTNPKPTTFDDVFRTIAQKMPYLMVELINEAFGTNYPEDVKISQHRNEFFTRDGKIITDMIFEIRDKWYHIECQSKPDSTMEIRMIEYDFMIAHENAVKESGTYIVRFPESAVLYLRHNKNTPDVHNVRVEMPNGDTAEYQAKVIKAQNYAKDEMFQKKLLVLVPFYLMRFEKNFKKYDKDEHSRNKFLEECEELRRRLEEETEDKGNLYDDIIGLILKVSDHILKGHIKTKKGVRDVMGGKVLELRSEKLIKQGRREGGNTMLYNLVSKGKLTVDEAAQEAGVSVSAFKKNMAVCGFKAP